MDEDSTAVTIDVASIELHKCSKCARPYKYGDYIYVVGHDGW